MEVLSSLSDDKHEFSLVVINIRHNGSVNT